MKHISQHINESLENAMPVNEGDKMTVKSAMSMSIKYDGLEIDDAEEAEDIIKKLFKVKPKDDLAKVKRETVLEIINWMFVNLGDDASNAIEWFCDLGFEYDDDRDEFIDSNA